MAQGLASAEACELARREYFLKDPSRRSLSDKCYRDEHWSRMCRSILLLPFLVASFIPVIQAINIPPLDVFIAPPGVSLLPEEYGGFELRWKRFVFRPGEFQKEGILIALVILYLINYFIGKRTNSTRAYAWINAHTALYASQFSTPYSSNEVIADGPTDLFGFSTGRRGLHYLHVSNVSTENVLRLT